jgi:dihydropteroate synthase
LNAKDSFFQVKSTLNIDGNLYLLDQPSVMGILNITPDSFYDGSRVEEESQIVERAQKMVHDGATILDIGGYSTRPGANDISEKIETQRVVKAISAIRSHIPAAIISVDTFRASVAREAIQAGANLINDVSGGNLDAAMFETVAELGVPYILMHMRGTPQTMKSLANYDNVVTAVYEELQQKLMQLHNLGIADVIVDPGFGFAKTISHNYELLKNLSYFRHLGVPLLAGISRKSMIYKTLNIEAADALNGTTALNMAALINGAQILRVHDVKEARECVTLYNRLQG